MCGALGWASTLLLLILSANAQLAINTPSNAGSCQTVQISWTGGTGPYQLQVVPGSHAGATAMRVLANDISTTSYQWKVDIVSGKNIALICQDSTGTQVATNAFTVASTGSNCSPQQGSQQGVGQASSSSSHSSSSVQTTSGGGSSSPSSSTPSSVNTSSSSTSSADRNTSSSSTSSADRSSSETISSTSNHNDTSSITSPVSDGAVASNTSTSPGSLNTGISPDNSNSHTNIVGPVVGGICALVAILLTVVLFFYCRRPRARQSRGISVISDGPDRSLSTIIEPFISPVTPSSPSPWHSRPSKYGFQNAGTPYGHPPPPPSSSNSSSGRTNVLTTDQVRLVQQLCTLQVPAAAMTQVIDHMLSNPRDASSEALSQPTPPAYDFKQ